MAAPLRSVQADGPVARILAAVRGAKVSGRGWLAQCPAHEDSSPSLSISEGAGGRALLKCHAGCSSEAIVAALNLTMSDLFADAPEAKSPRATRRNYNAPIVATYDYTNEDGEVLFQVCRKEWTDERGERQKEFPQRRPDPTADGGWSWKLGDVRRVLYRLPLVIAARQKGRVIFIAEGEKDVHSLEAAGFVATTSPGGASKNPDNPKWRDEYAEPLAGGDVVICADNDDAGRAHAEATARSCHAKGCKVRVLHFTDVPEKGGDVTDWLASHTAADLKALVKAAPLWTPSAMVAGPSFKDLSAKQTTETRDLLNRDITKALRWPWPELDALTGPLLPGEFHVVGALTNNGKSAFVMSLTDVNAKVGIPTLFFPLETDAKTYRLRWAAWELGIDVRHALRQDWNKLPHGAKDALDCKIQEQTALYPHIHFAPDQLVNPATMESRIRQAVAEFGCRAVIIDHVHRIDYDDSVRNPRQHFERFVRRMQTIGRELDIVTLGTAQLNRSLDPLDWFCLPPLGRIKDTAVIGEEANVVLMLSRRIRDGALPADHVQALKLGTLDLDQITDEAVMVATCRKHRLDGKALNKTVRLGLDNGRVVSRRPIRESRPTGRDAAVPPERPE